VSRAECLHALCEQSVEFLNIKRRDAYSNYCSVNDYVTVVTICTTMLNAVIPAVVHMTLPVYPPPPSSIVLLNVILSRVLNVRYWTALLYHTCKARARTHGQICNIYCFSWTTMIANAPHCYVICTLPVLLKL
jgi:hypothetical protein